MKNIYEYDSYRLLLKDFYQEKKSSHKYTYRDFSSAANMNSSSWLLHLIRGTKNLSEKTTEVVANVLGLRKKEREYFGVLVKFTQSRKNDEKNEFYRQMVALREKMGRVDLLSDSYAYYTKWYHPVVRSMVSKVDFRDDYAKLARSLIPPITPLEARKSVKLLLDLGMIKQNDDGSWSQTGNYISTGDEVKSLNIVNYHRQVSELAIDVYDRSESGEREISALTLGISQEEFELIKHKIVEFRKEIIDIVNNSGAGDRVYQLNFQFFQVGKGKDIER